MKSDSPTSSNDVEQARESIEELGLTQIFAILRSRWVFSFLAPLLAAAATYWFTLSLPSEYEGSVVLATSDSVESLSGRGNASGSVLGSLSSLAGLGAKFGGDNTGIYLAELQSRKLLLEFIEKQNLMKGLFPERWNSANSTWIADKSARPKKDGEPGAWEAYRKMAGRIEISKNFAEGTILLSLFWGDPETASKLANELVAFLNERARQRQMKEAELSLAYLQKRLGRTNNAELKLATAQLMQGQLERLLVAQGVEDYVFRIIDPAIPSFQPTRPRRLVIAALALIMAVILGSGAALYSYRRKVS